MPLDTQRQEEPGTPPALRLANAWADFTKALSIYPETNTRVKAQLDELVGMIAAELASRGPGHDPERGITILFHDTTVHVDKDSYESPDGSSLPWLRERLTHAGLAGIEFMPDLGPDALVAFTKRLLANFLRKESGLTHDDLWPETFDALVLIDLRFEGTFGGLAAEGPYRGGHRGTAVRGAETNHFLRGLLAHPKVTRRVTMLGDQTQRDDEETVSAADLLKRILDDVPAEALKSRDALITAVCNVMDNLQEPSTPTMGVRSDGSGEAGSGEFASLLYDVSRRHFGRKGPGLERLRPDTSQAVEQTPGGGRKRDDAIQDDVHALVDEVASLPSELAYEFGAGEAESPAEQLATMLHYLTQLERPHKLPGLYPALARLVQNPGRAELDVLRDHLLTPGVTPEATERAHAAIVQFLLASGHPHLLRQSGVLTPEFVLADPAARLPLMVAGINMDHDAERAELDEVCRTLGTTILESEDTMRAALADLPRDQAANVLHRPSSSRLPLVRALLAAHPERLVPETTAFLRSLDLPQDEAFVLFQLHDPAHITRTYLLALIDLHLGRTNIDVVHSAVVELLCRHIRATHSPMPEHPERLESIRSLARYPSANGWVLLKELQKTAFGPFGGSEPPAVRKLAKSIAKQMRNVKDDVPLDEILDGSGGGSTQAA